MKLACYVRIFLDEQRSFGEGSHLRIARSKRGYGSMVGKQHKKGARRKGGGRGRKERKNMRKV